MPSPDSAAPITARASLTHWLAQTLTAIRMVLLRDSATDSATDSHSAAVLMPWLLMLFVGITMMSFNAADSGSRHHVFIAISFAVTGIGCLALTRIRPQRAGLSPPHVMLSLGFGGMLIGLLIDMLHAGPILLESICRSGAQLVFLDSLLLHLYFLPAMHIGMLLGGLLAIPALRILHPHCGRYLCSMLAQNLLCSSWMLIGMTLGALWMSRWSKLLSDLPAINPLGDQAGGGLGVMLGGMFAGMTWGMVISVALYRLFIIWRTSRRHLPLPLRP
jgi:hypothetical protein